MPARIYQPSRSAMQSGQAKTRQWVLEYAPEAPRVVDPLMGWTSSADLKSQVRLTFESREAAVAYAQKHGIPYVIREKEPRAHILRQNGYGDNFAHARRLPWTH